MNSEGELESTDCSSSTKCKSPILVEYTGLDTAKYGCGSCTIGTEGITCVSCEANEDAPCNGAVSTGKTFKCFPYAFNTTTKTWEAGSEAGTCIANEDTSIACNK